MILASSLVISHTSTPQKNFIAAVCCLFFFGFVSLMIMMILMIIA